MSDIIEDVEPKDLRVGDVILGCRGPSMTKYNPWPLPEVATAPVKTGYRYEFVIRYVETGKTATENKPGDFLFKIRRGPPSTGLAAAAKPTRHIDDFPGSCPLCGAKAYVGALEVAHKDERAAAGCTARRA